MCIEAAEFVLSDNLHEKAGLFTEITDVNQAALLECHFICKLHR